MPTYDELVLVANSDRLESDSGYADRVRRLAATLVDGTQGALADPQGAIAVMDRVTDYETSFLEASVPATLALLTRTAVPSDAWTLLRGSSSAAGCTTTGLLDLAFDTSNSMTNAYLADC